jgi:hypothetical protein
MPDQRRSFPMGRGIRTTVKQVRTKQLGLPRGGNLRDGDGTTSVSGAPTRPLRDDDAQTLSQRGRDAVMD